MDCIGKLQSRWKLKNKLHVWLVLAVFACTGFSVMFLKPLVKHFFISQEVDPTLFTIAYYILILPIYNVILLGYGFIFGMFSFFWEFEMRMYRRIFGRSDK